MITKQLCIFQVIKELAKELFREVIDDMAISIVQPLTRAIQLYLDLAKHSTNAVIEEVVDPQTRHVLFEF